MSTNSKKLYISIPQPCSEDWEKMEKKEAGRFCMNCRQTVIDFTQMTDTELFNYFSVAPSIPCGRFNTVQLNRAIEPLSHTACFPSYFKSIAAAVAVLISVKAYPATPAINHPVMQLVQKPGAFNNEITVKDSLISGTVKDDNGRPVANAKVSSVVFGDVYTDSLGRFSIDLSNGKAIPQSIIFSYDRLVSAVRSYHPAMSNAVYDIVLYDKPTYYSCDIMGAIGGAPQIAVIDLPSLTFSKKSAELSKDAKAMLALTAMKLKENPSVNIKLTAYPGKYGTAQKITDQRLTNMINYLVEKLGISSDRLITEKLPGAGSTNVIDLKVD